MTMKVIENVTERYVWHKVRVVDVVNRELIVGGKKSADGKAELFMEPAGWVIVLEGGMSINVGHEQPTIKKGQRVTLTLQGE